MKAIFRDRYGSVDVLECREVALPVPGEGEVRVRVHAASINDFDLGMLHGVPRFIRLFGVGTGVRILGCDIAGRVEATGSGVTRFEIGDAVFGDLSECGFGAFAEQVCVPEGALLAKPGDLGFEDAAALPQAATLFMQAAFDQAHIEAGQQLLINGAGGGVGTLGLQIAKAHGLGVTCVDSADKLDLLRELGADRVVDYRTEDYTRLGCAFDAIIDAKSSKSPRAITRALKPGGVYVTVGGSMLRLLQYLMLGPLIARTTGRRLRIVALDANRHLDRVLELIAARRLHVVVDPHRFGFDEIPDALAHFATARHLGKVVVRYEAASAAPEPARGRGSG